MFLGRVVTKIKDYIFPVYCLDCGQEGFWLCENCYRKLDLSGRFFCPICHQTSLGGSCCVDCSLQSELDQEIAILKYSDQEIIGQIIHNLKYNYVEGLQVLIEKLIKDFLRLNPNLFIGVKQIVPVPLHKKRYAERGFNQAEIIAQILSRKLSIPINKNLQRKKFTQQQAKLNKEQRENNIKEAFVFEEYEIANVILLVDDVFTTGSTMQACAKVMKERGVGKVVGFTLARG